MSQWRNLVFEGGGVKGLAYAGALEVLESEHVLEDIVRVGGSSAGGITAGMLAVGMTPQEIREVLDETDFKRFMDDDWGVVRDTARLFKEFGWHKGEAFKFSNGSRMTLALTKGQRRMRIRLLQAEF